MLPLDPLDSVSPLPRLLRSAPAAEVHAELDRLEELLDAVCDPAAAPAGSALLAAALGFGRGAIALREGALDAAVVHLDGAAAAFDREGETEARDLARCEAALARMRRDAQSACDAAVVELGAIAAAGDPGRRAAVVADHYRGTAERLLGDAAAAQRTLLSALRRSEPFLGERAQILNSLGTLYVALGAYGAAEALLEHAAELHRRRGDAVGEAIACGQLGAAALGLGALERARAPLQRQEWLCARLGDAFGRARALTFLSELALELGRADDALALATCARDVAERAAPPLRTWIAYAARAIGRARRDLGDPGAAAALDEAGAIFRELGHPLGAALAAWDHATAEALALGGPAVPVDWFAAAWALGSLGLPARVAQLLRERLEIEETAPPPERGGGPAPDGEARERALAAAAQTSPHVAVQREVELVYDRPDELAGIAVRRTAANRNLGRLAALTLAPPGLAVAAVAALRLGTRGLALPPERAVAACVADLPGITVWIWPANTEPHVIGRDLAALGAALGELPRAALALAPAGRVLCPPFAGDAGAELEAVEVGALIALSARLAMGELHLDPRLGWDGEACASVEALGFAVSRPAGRPDPGWAGRPGRPDPG
ncbi:hypothetical protein [Sorangium cellulosum]|uniref:MalT-like TPR region domain-containing protein n=1 Tax=Sorangium cellulosum TaxID=56 RepID=A0A150QXQ3_SORCE|nr:hypothetical protein [Sorangium cellulosum]KYF72661.1 hypothetical protein BE15_00990 [Sorangium cellulosum]